MAVYYRISDRPRSAIRRGKAASESGACVQSVDEFPRVSERALPSRCGTSIRLAERLAYSIRLRAFYDVVHLSLESRPIGPRPVRPVPRRWPSRTFPHRARGTVSTTGRRLWKFGRVAQLQSQVHPVDSRSRDKHCPVCYTFAGRTPLPGRAAMAGRRIRPLWAASPVC